MNTWSVFFFFFPLIEEGSWEEERQEVGLPPGRSVFFGEKTSLRELPVSLIKLGLGVGRRGAGTGLEEECGSNFT